MPAGHATAIIGYGIYEPGPLHIGQTRIAVATLNQDPVQGFQSIGTYGSGIDEVDVANSDGATGTQIGVGVVSSLKQVCG